MPDYKKQAQSEYDVTYNNKVQGLKNTLASNLLQLDQSKSGINQNFDNQVTNQNRANILGKNNYSNTMLGRGMARSSIVGTGLAEQDQINTRKVGEINTNRTGALNDIESRKALMNSQFNDQLNGMAGEREMAINNLARQLEDRDRSYNLELERLALQKAAQRAQNGMSEQDMDEYNRYVSGINEQMMQAEYTDSNGSKGPNTAGNRMSQLANFEGNMKGMSGGYVKPVLDYISQLKGKYSGELSADRYNAIPRTYAPGITARKQQSVPAVDMDYYKNLLKMIRG